MRGRWAGREPGSSGALRFAPFVPRERSAPCLHPRRLNLLGLFEPQQKLVLRQRLGPAAEAVALQFLDDLAQTLVLDLARQHHRFERGQIVGKLVRRCRKRLVVSRLTFHEGETRLIKFGRFVATTCCRRRERRPETFAFLRFSSIRSILETASIEVSARRCATPRSRNGAGCRCHVGVHHANVRGQGYFSRRLPSATTA